MNKYRVTSGLFEDGEKFVVADGFFIKDCGIAVFYDESGEDLGAYDNYISIEVLKDGEDRESNAPFADAHEKQIQYSRFCDYINWNAPSSDPNSIRYYRIVEENRNLKTELNRLRCQLATQEEIELMMQKAKEKILPEMK